MIRLALPDEAAVMRDVVHAAYAHYIDRIGKPPELQHQHVQRHLDISRIQWRIRHHQMQPYARRIDPLTNDHEDGKRTNSLRKQIQHRAVSLGQRHRPNRHTSLARDVCRLYRHAT